MKLTLKRFLAFIIDYFIIAIYALILLFVSLSLSDAFSQDKIDASHPVKGQLIGFFTLTLPVILYGYLMESRRWNATLGKRIFKLKVQSNSVVSKKPIFMRNCLKFLPWEIAHTGIHWMFYYEALQIETPLWIWLVLILPQIIVLIYAVSIIVSKGQTSLYDKLANTYVIR